MRAPALALMAALLLPGAALADQGAPPAPSPEVQRLLEAKKTLNWNVTLPGKSEKYGHAEALVDAPAEKVRDTAVQFGRYKELHRKFASARVVAKEGDNTDVYMKLPVKLGPIQVDQWEVMRFGPARMLGGGVHVVEGRGVKGNMKDGHMIITIKPVDAKHSLLKVDLLLVPNMPAPQAMVEEELRDAALDFVNGLKDKSQGWVGPVVSL